MIPLGVRMAAFLSVPMVAATSASAEKKKKAVSPAPAARSAGTAAATSPAARHSLPWAQPGLPSGFAATVATAECHVRY